MNRLEKFRLYPVEKVEKNRPRVSKESTRAQKLLSTTALPHTDSKLLSAAAKSSQRTVQFGFTEVGRSADCVRERSSTKSDGGIQRRESKLS